MMSEDLIKCTVAFLGGAVGGFVAGFTMGENYAKDEAAKVTKAELEEVEEPVTDEDPEVVVHFPDKNAELEEVDEPEEVIEEESENEPEEAENKEE